MDLPKRNKLMMLFLSAKNPLLYRTRRLERGWTKFELKDDDITDTTGISRETPKNWRRGKEMRPSKVDEVFARTLKTLDDAAALARSRGSFNQDEYADLRDRIQRYSAAVIAEDASLYDAASILGMSVTHCQQAMDAIVYDSWPLLPAVWYDKEPRGKHERDIAREHLQRYEGVYLLWVRRGTLWLQCPLRVRYLQPGGEGVFIRCKLNFPIIERKAAGGEGPHGYWGYDGFLAVRERNLFWTFEKRQSDRNDYFHFITNADLVDQRSFVLTGRYLSTGQDKDQSIVNSDILLHRLFTDPDDPLHLSYRDVMWSHAKVLTDPTEIAAVNRRWTEYGARRASQQSEEETTLQAF